MFTDNALVILEKRYLKKDEAGLETPEDMFKRVALNIAEAEYLYGKSLEEVQELSDAFYHMMINLDFLPNSPTLRGAGRELQQLFACFVLPIEDSLEGIMSTLKTSSLVHKTGGGTGFSFSRLRSKKEKISTTGNYAGGPVSFMRLFNAAAQEITQGGVRMGANMGILKVDHPDIFDFITCKSDGSSIQNFNISVAVTDKFMEAVKQDQNFDLVSPHTGQVVLTLKAREIFDKIVLEAWRTGDPGLIFIDQINRKHPVPYLGQIESTNPCGEQPLLPYESCVLGSINLSNFYIEGGINWGKLEQTIKLAVHFLDNIVDQNKYPVAEIEKATKGTRKIGLGVMGFADLLIKLGIPYNSDHGVELGRKLMEFISLVAQKKSSELAKEKGVFPYYQEGQEVRNACLTTVAPTGTLSTIASVSGGIEPLFAIVYKRHTLFNAQGATESLLVIDPNFEKIAKEKGFYSEELIEEISKTGSIQHIDAIPADIKRLFVTSHDISPEWHVKMQAAFQENIDSAVSKTINFTNNATKEDIAEAYMLAYDLGCKGITIYRDGSKSTQVLTTDNKQSKVRSKKLQGRTYKKQTHLGSLYVTINQNGIDPFEVFINVGKGGSDLNADAEGLGRLISLILRMPSNLTSVDRVKEIAGQLKGIGSSRSLGFGSNRVMSLPDAVGQVLMDDLGLKEFELSKLPDEADICPGCGFASLINIEGCKKCFSCGHSEC